MKQNSLFLTYKLTSFDHNINKWLHMEILFMTSLGH